MADAKYTAQLSPVKGTLDSHAKAGNKRSVGCAIEERRHKEGLSDDGDCREQEKQEQNEAVDGEELEPD